MALPAEAKDVVIDGKRLETLRYPPTSEQTTIVLLHEGLGSVALWRNFPEQVAEATGCGVLAYSRYGHGKSERLAEKRTIEFMHHEGTVVLPELLEAFHLKKPILLGHSDGGSIAIIYAGSAKESPLALILEAPHVFVEDFGLESIRKIKTVYGTSDLPQKLGRYHDHVDETFWGWNDVWLDANFRNWNIEEFLPRIRCPILAIQGKSDDYGTIAQLEAIQRQVPQTRICLFDPCGHSPHRDQTEATLQAISIFVESVLADRNEPAF